MGVVKKGFVYSGLRTLKLAVSEEGINGTNRFFKQAFPQKFPLGKNDQILSKMTSKQSFSFI